MIFDATRLAFANLFGNETRSVFWKVLGLALLLLAALWFGVLALLVYFALPWWKMLFLGAPQWAGWLTFFSSLVGIGLGIALIVPILPMTVVIAGLFLDDVAELVERKTYADDPPGRAMPFGEALVSSFKFFGVVIAGNLIALLLLFVPGVNLLAFFLVNGYLLGREFFEFAAMRFRLPADARLFRRKHRSTVFLAGLVIAAFLTIPVLNLLTPLFAASLMVHLHKAVSRRDSLFATRCSENLGR